MITIVLHEKGNTYAVHADGDCKEVQELYGLSSDTKPTEGVNNADVFYEMDTQAVFLFDETNKVWLEQ